MAGWVRYSMWDRWRDLTRFRLACEMALDSYKTYVNEFPLSSTAPLIVHDPSGDTGFKCDLGDFKQVLNDGEMLYHTLYPTYVALIEDLARELIERLITEKGVARSKFPGLKAGDAVEAAEAYVMSVPVEAWADVILGAGGRDWSKLKGGKRAVVEAITVRNLCAHGVPVFNKKAINRIEAAPGTKAVPREGGPIRLDKKRFAAYTATLRTFARALADSVASLPDAQVG
jgi:hypothetical protein